MLGMGLGVALALACWREWPLPILAALAVGSAKAWSEDLEGWYVVPPILFAAAAIGFGAWWLLRRRRVFIGDPP